MPRPGPRPYECVRRAWHSDRHQPMRGSLIQEIFRVVNEIHSPATKKNKEWQEKLPVVVLKAEEIMYSKANSEAEYMDLKTLLDRTNDAINSIIRLDESTETGEFLQPCIEGCAEMAALHLGCTPRKASRSQRNIDPRCYLSPISQQLNSSNNLIFTKPSAKPSINTTNHLSQLNNFARNNFPSASGKNAPFEKCPSSKYSVYPVFRSSQVLPEPYSNTIIKPLTSNIDKRPAQTHIKFMHENMNYGGCDLSLRLGTFQDNGSNPSKRSKLNDPKPACCNNLSSRWVPKDESFTNTDATKRKKDETFSRVMEDLRFSWLSKLSYS